MTRIHQTLLACLAAALLLLAPATIPGAWSADHKNLEEGLPVEVEDAYPIAYRGTELQGLFRYDRQEHKDRFTLEPRLEMGIAPNAQARITSPFFAGNADKTGSGDVALELFYNFNMESLYVPALALSAEAEFPSGHRSNGVDTTVKFIASKMPFVNSSWLHRLHLNMAWTHNSGREEKERADMYKAILGFSGRVDPDTILVMDILRETEREKDKELNIVEVGLRRQLTPLTVVAIGVGAGIGDESPDFRATVAFQHALTWPWF